MRMTRDELRRLAIRLAMTAQGSVGEYPVACRACMHDGPSAALRHRAHCPIAALEAEEAASKAVATWCGVDIESIETVDGTRTIMLRGDDWTAITLNHKDGEKMTGWIRGEVDGLLDRLETAKKKTAGEFAGEFG